MNRRTLIEHIRQRLANGGRSIGSWMQIGHPSIAEIMGAGGYDWIAVDLEHGSIGISQLPNLFRALELGGTLPMARLARGHPKDCKLALDAGAGGVIVPMIESAEQLQAVCQACRWPPAGNRGVSFSRANLYGQRFDEYALEAQAPLVVAMIEQARALDHLEDILQVPGLDALLIGPYDLAASLGLTADFKAPRFLEAIQHIRRVADLHGVPRGVHLVQPAPDRLELYWRDGDRFLAYSIDAVFLNQGARCPCPMGAAMP
ncbi:HpcH/HpaI aldolase family protein [Thiorhodovibrio frisius]|uniref:2,4-dihydroxyhept-2-ene-1,7-dioic acid aldolase n=1 Tax=Thiorhodovibrio frisius TaxID=631362 RepID=H8Z0B4_9GAMM|nr:aldolase/citrate lyase family protein [Thiorhodovibrio frisius]EIC22322.1 2,4-dihydroxyhept-2-ene-1,7-dioic acid aldolase [Thiorhodovibrio frisius]WPL24619.1 5-keto-4-deoxy-D-glucarate aldolase [Thiorhodovibrio frisius]